MRELPELFLDYSRTTGINKLEVTLRAKSAVDEVSKRSCGKLLKFRGPSQHKKIRDPQKGSPKRALTNVCLSSRFCAWGVARSLVRVPAVAASALQRSHIRAHLAIVHPNFGPVYILVSSHHKYSMGGLGLSLVLVRYSWEIGLILRAKAKAVVPVAVRRR